MPLTQDNSALPWLEEVKGVHFADSLRGGGDSDESELPRRPENRLTVGRVECLNFIEEKRHGTVVASQLVFQQKQIEQHF